MRWITLFLFAALAVTSVDAASYQKTDGTIVNPIQSIFGNDLSHYHGINLEPGAHLIGANLTSADLDSANLTHANLHSADLTLAHLTDANLTHANLHSADLTLAHLTDAHLIGANLTDAKLDDADLRWANLSDTNLTLAHLTDAILYNANLTGARLARANLTAADFTNAILTGANFTGATDPPSTSSQLALTPLDETIIGGAQLHEAIFSGADLSSAIFNHDNDDLDAVGWETATWTGAHFHYLNPTLFPTGMIYTDHGIVVRTPEPATLLLALLGLALLPRRRRR